MVPPLPVGQFVTEYAGPVDCDVGSIEIVEDREGDGKKAEKPFLDVREDAPPPGLRSQINPPGASAEDIVTILIEEIR